MESEYVCPRTRVPLHRAGEVLRSEDGNITYPVRSGIPSFLCFDPAEDEATEAQLTQLNVVAAANGWKAALASTYGEDMIRYVSDSRRARFIDLLPLDSESSVLEIGPGLGQFTPILARRSKSVHALEIVAGQAEFAARRCREEGAGNVEFAVGGDDCRLPYRDAAFDVVVLNLVFEWCAGRCVNEDFVAVQDRLLGELSRVIKKGGSLYLATKNRFALRYVLGKTDEHSYHMPFGNALPRSLHRLAMRLAGHERPLGILHSYRRLKRMLQAAGFDKTASFWATPEMRFPEHYVPTDAASIRSARQQLGFVQGDSRSSRLLMPLIPAGLVKYFTPGLAFLASKAR